VKRRRADSWCGRLIEGVARKTVAQFAENVAKLV
jgi:hypothetical protein